MRGAFVPRVASVCDLVAGALVCALGVAACNDGGASDTSTAPETRADATEETVAPADTGTTQAETLMAETAANEVALDSEPVSEVDASDEVAETTPDADSADGLGPDVAYEHDPAKLVLHGACPLETRVGGFHAQMNLDVGYSAVDGTVRNGVPPAQVPLEAAAEGGCRILQKRHLFCDPACDSTSTCGLDNVCVAAPLGQDMGTVTLRGLVKLVEMVATQPGNTYFYTRLSNPGFAPGDVIQLTSTAGYMGALELYGVGVSAIAPAKLVLTKGTPATLTWDAPTTNMRSEVHVELTIDQHGVTPVNLVCDFADTGAGTIPAAIVDGLIGFGVTGFPSGTAERRTVDSVVVAGQCAEFVVTATRQLGIEVTDFVPCTSTGNCPDGKTCNLSIQQCQ